MSSKIDISTSNQSRVFLHYEPVNANQSTIDSIPDELIFLIISKLNFYDLGTTYCINKSWSLLTSKCLRERIPEISKIFRRANFLKNYGEPSQIFKRRHSNYYNELKFRECVNKENFISCAVSKIIPLLKIRDIDNLELILSRIELQTPAEFDNAYNLPEFSASDKIRTIEYYSCVRVLENVSTTKSIFLNFALNLCMTEGYENCSYKDIDVEFESGWLKLANLLPGPDFIIMDNWDLQNFCGGVRFMYKEFEQKKTNL